MLEIAEDVQKKQDAYRLADILTTLQRRLILHLSKELARGHVSLVQYSLLGFLEHEECLSMSEIAIRMGHTTAAATGLVDRLEALSYVQRIHCENDRRKIQVHITGLGKQLVAQVRDDMVCNVECILSHLTAEQQKTWVQIYEIVLQHCTPNCGDK